MGQITVDQSHQVLAALAANTNWEAIDFKESGLQDLVIRNPQEAGKQFTTFLQHGGRVFVGDPRIISIDRQPFDPGTFLGKGWTIEGQDERSLQLTEVDLSNILLRDMLRQGEDRINGEERLRRLKAENLICLDARVFQAFWNNQHLIPKSWKEKTRGHTTFIFFDGTVFQSPRGLHYVLCLCWSASQWSWHYYWLGDVWRVSNPSAVLAR